MSGSGLRYRRLATTPFLILASIPIFAVLFSGCNPYGECVEHEKAAANDLPPAVRAKLDNTWRDYSMHDSLIAAGAQILVQQQDYEVGPRKKIVLNGHTRGFEYITSVVDVRPKSFDVLTGPRVMEDIGPLSFLPGAQISRFLTLSQHDLSTEREVSICGHMRKVARQGKFVYVRTYVDSDEVEYGRVRLPQQ